MDECIILDFISYNEISIFFLPRYICKGWAWRLFWSVLRSWLFIALIEAKYGFSLHCMCMHERCDLVTKYSIAVRSRYNLCHFAYTVQVLAPWKNNCVKDVFPVCWAFRGLHYTLCLLDSSLWPNATVLVITVCVRLRDTLMYCTGWFLSWYVIIHMRNHCIIFLVFITLPFVMCFLVVERVS